MNTHGLLDSIETVPVYNIKSYEITVHSIKGSSYGICADAVGRIAGDLERAAKEYEFEYIKKHNVLFIAVVRKLINDIDNLLDSLHLDSLKPKKDKPDISSLHDLITACIDYDMDEVDKAMEEITAYQYESDDGLVAWLKDNVNMMNFDEIVEKLTDIVDTEDDGNEKDSEVVML